MKHLKMFEARRTNIQRKLELLRILAQDLTDIGIEVSTYNGSRLVYGDSSRFMEFVYMSDDIYNTDLDKIFLIIVDNEGILSRPILESDEIVEFFEVLKSHNMLNRGYGSGNDHIVIYFDKYGKMTRSDSWKYL